MVVSRVRVKAVVLAGNGCGEGVVWDSRRGLLWWTDIPARRLHRYHWKSRTAQVFDTPERVGSFGLVAGRDELITAFESGIALYPYLEPALDELTWLARPQADVGGVRFNDGRVDRRGRFWCGTMVEEDGSAERGNLYSIEGTQDVRCHVTGVM